MHIKKVIFSVSLVLATSSVFAQSVNQQSFTFEKPYKVEKVKAPKGKKVKNVILMIGDGMSLMHIQAAWTCNRGHLWLENAQFTGFSKTPATNKLITDSGSGGTSLATGYKTRYHAVGVDADGNKLKSLVDYAKEAGKGAGVVVTCRLWDATPCDFLSHNIDRDKEEELIAEMANSPVDYVFGGGAKLFTNRKDNRNIFKELEKKGYQVITSNTDLRGILKEYNEKKSCCSGKSCGKERKVFCVPFEVDTPLPDERGDLLARASIAGMNMLSHNKNGFFMMIEGSQLDDYGHFNQLDMLMKETLDFDQTFGRVIKWAAEDGETLVVVTADHETGGLTVLGGDFREGRVEANFSTKSHSGTIVPVYAFGPGSENFSGFMDNTDICWKIKALMNM